MAEQPDALREANELLGKVYALMQRGEVTLTHGARGGIWCLPDQIGAWLEAQDTARAAGVPASSKWLPTAENINALPEPLRRYVHDLETMCDPAGLVRENAQLKDSIAGLQVMYRKVASGVQACATEQECTQKPWCRINGKCQRAAGVSVPDRQT